jgi:hypothetical protein
VQECARSAGERALDQRGSALVNRLLVEGDQRGFPLTLLHEPANAAARLDWRERATRAVIEALAEVEQVCTNPRGWRRWLRGTLTTLANFLPEASLVATAGYVLFDFFVNSVMPDTFRVALIAIVPLVVVIIFHLLIMLLLPVRWPMIRGEFRKRLEARLVQELERAYLPIPTDLAAALQEERKQVDQLIANVKEITEWLAVRQQAAQVAELYGN